MNLDLYSSVPAYRQLAELLRRRIESGELRPGQTIPSESALWQEHGIARATVRRAIEILREEGLVVTVQGRGSFVTPE